MYLKSSEDSSSDLHLELKNLRKQLLNLTRLMLMSEMIGGIAHDLNNNLGVIRLYADQLADLKANYSEEDKAFLAQAISSIDLSIIKSEHMVSHLRSFLRENINQPTEFHLNSSIEEVFAIFEKQLVNRGVSVSKDIESSLPSLKGNKVLIEQALMHLLIVARDAVSNASKKEIRIHSEAGPSGDQIKLVLEETGNDGPKPYMHLLNVEPASTGGWNNHDWCMVLTGRLIRQWGGTIDLKKLTPTGCRLEIVLPATQNISSEKAA